MKQSLQQLISRFNVFSMCKYIFVLHTKVLRLLFYENFMRINGILLV